MLQFIDLEWQLTTLSFLLNGRPSTDLNTIENAWLMIKRKLQTHACEMNSVDDLYDTIFEIGRSFCVEYIRNLYESMPARIRKGQRAQGYVIKY